MQCCCLHNPVYFCCKRNSLFFGKFYFQKAQSGELQYSGAHTRQGYLGVQRKGQNKFGIYWTYSNLSLCIALVILIRTKFTFLLLFYFMLGGLGTTWTKHYCMYTKENKILTMIPYTQTQGRMVS